MARPLERASEPEHWEPVPAWAVGHTTDCGYCGRPFAIERGDRHKAGLLLAIFSIKMMCPHCDHWTLVWLLGVR